MSLKISDFGVIGRNITAWVMFFSVMAGASAQGGMTRYYLGNSGIPDNSVYAIHVAPDGNIWVGTDHGLGKFDGNNWEVFRTANSGLPSDYVRSIVTDDSGFVWIGTATNGLARFDGQNWTAYNTTNSDLPDDFVRSLGVIPGGGIWIGTTGGAVRMQNGVMNVYNYLAQGSESNNVASINVQDTHVVWLGMVNGGLIRQSDTGFVDYTIHNSALTDNTILGIARDGDDLWMATPANGVIYYWNLAFISYHPFNSGSPSSSYNSVTEDMTSSLWFGSVDSGVVFYDRTNWRSFNSTNSAMPQDYIRSVTYDAVRDVIWVGTNSEGLVKMDRSVVLSSQEQLSVEGMAVYPQPCSQTLTLEMPQGGRGGWKILDLRGVELLNGEVHAGQNPINVGGLSAGTYFLRVGATTRKIVVGTKG